MKQFLRPIGQCLTTAVMTSTMLEAYALPAPGTTSPEPSQAQAVEVNPSPEQESVPPAPSQELIAPPETFALPERTLTLPESIKSELPETVLPSDSPASPAAAELDTSGEAAISDTPQPALDAIAGVDTVETVRQLLAKKLAAMVERDRPAKEAELRENLVAAAIAYATAGDFDQARLTAQHPALPPDIQSTTLAKIAEIQAQHPGPVPTAETQAIATAQPLTVTPISGARNSNFPQNYRPINYSGQICTNSTPVVARPALDKTTVLKLATELSQGQLIERPAGTDLASLPPTFKDFELATGQIEWGQSLAPTKQATPPQSIAQSPTEQIPVQDSANGSVNLKVRHMVGSTFFELLDETDQMLQPAIPSAIQAALGWWMKPESKAARLDQSSTMQSPLPTGRSLPPTPDQKPEGDHLGAQPPSLASLPPSTLETADATDASAIATLPTQLQSLDGPLILNVGQDMVGDLQSPPTTIGKLGKGIEPKNWQSDVKVATLPTVATSQDFDCGSGLGTLSLIYNNVQSALAEQLNKLGMAFPLPIPASITSAFGWRIHPITGDRRFHDGIDFGAPYGTPVLASDAGQVVVANRMGGYGLAVVIENGQAARRNLYAHLSNIAVQPGTWVERGTVIGWVGSTGNSTGPHLHFEVQQMTSNGWAAVDPIAFAARADGIAPN